MRSIERYLVVWIIGALTFGLVLVTLVAYLVTLDEMNEVFDADLRNVATAVATYHHSGHGPDSGQAPRPPLSRAQAIDETDIVTQTWDRAGRRIFVSNPDVNLPFSAVEGLSYPMSNGESWIVYTTVLDSGVVQAAQRKAARREIAQESATRILPPMLLLIGIVSGLMVFALRRGLVPLDAAARDVAARSEHSLDPIPTGDVPRELMPLAIAVNGLMDRLSTTLSAQRRFLADAAHELRTPVTALRLQAQLLERSVDDAARASAQAELKSGIERSQRLIEQLLQVARSGLDGEAMRLESIDLADLARSVVVTMSVKADHKGIDLGAETASAVGITGDRAQLTVLLNNLVENALRYTPAGGVVDVAAGWLNDRPALRVIDSGAGIAPADRERVFDRFYRGESAAAHDAGGSGLGLAIVQAIARRHHAEVSLHTPESGIGVEVRVVFNATAERLQA